MSLHDASQEQLTDMLYAEGSTPPYWERRHIVEPQTGHFSNLLTKARVQWGLPPFNNFFSSFGRFTPNRCSSHPFFPGGFGLSGYRFACANGCNTRFL